jgi:hypothetical protein
MSSFPEADVLARPWLSADAGRWVSLRVPLWARPVGPAAVLLVAVIAAIAAAPDEVCTAGQPCAADWLDAVGTMLFVPYLLSLFALPELAAVLAPLLLLYMAEPSQWHGGAAEKIADSVVVMVLGWGWAAVMARLRVRRRQRSVVRDAAGGIKVLAPVPDDFRPWQRGLFRCVVGVLMCAAACALITTVVLDNRADDRTAGTAKSQEAPVVAYNGDEYTLTVRLADGTRHQFDVIGSYHDDNTVRVLTHGSWVRLASEPYGDRTDRQLVALSLAGLGLPLLVSGLFARRGAAALRRGPVPVLRVLSRERWGRTEIFATDDADGASPILNYKPHISNRTNLRSAHLYGLPSEGGELVLASATEFGNWSVDATVSPIRLGAAADPDTGSIDTKQSAAQRRSSESLLQEALTSMSQGAGHVRWQAGPVARCVAAVFGIAVIALLGVLASEVSSWWHSGYLWLIGLNAVISAHRMLSWRVTADPAGLHVRKHWRTRLLPWTDVTSAVYTARGGLTLSCRPGVAHVSLGTVGFPALERGLNRPSRAARAAVEISAMVQEPNLRPKDNA